AHLFSLAELVAQELLRGRGVDGFWVERLIQRPDQENRAIVEPDAPLFRLDFAHPEALGDRVHDLAVLLQADDRRGEIGLIGTPEEGVRNAEGGDQRGLSSGLREPLETGMQKVSTATAPVG